MFLGLSAFQAGLVRAPKHLPRPVPEEPLADGRFAVYPECRQFYDSLFFLDAHEDIRGVVASRLVDP